MFLQLNERSLKDSFFLYWKKTNIQLKRTTMSYFRIAFAVIVREQAISAPGQRSYTRVPLAATRLKGLVIIYRLGEGAEDFRGDHLIYGRTKGGISRT